MAHRGLSLEISMSCSSEFADLENTYRSEGLTVGTSKLVEVYYHDLVILKRIGQGACSSVFVSEHKDSRTPYAIKMFNHYDRAQESQLKTEIMLLANLQCDALIALKGAFKNDDSVGIILEFMDRGSLEFILDRNVELNREAFAAISYQILWGLSYLHYEQKMHRDIKPANVLLNSHGFVKLSDFGISREMNRPSPPKYDSKRSSGPISGAGGEDGPMALSHVGTFRYMSPERLLGEPYDQSADMWSFGIMALELWMKVYLFEDCCRSPIDLSMELKSVDLPRLLRRRQLTDEGILQLVLGAMGYLGAGERTPKKVFSAPQLLGCPLMEQCGIVNLFSAREILVSWLRRLDRQRDNRRQQMQQDPFGGRSGAGGGFGVEGSGKGPGGRGGGGGRDWGHTSGKLLRSADPFHESMESPSSLQRERLDTRFGDAKGGMGGGAGGGGGRVMGMEYEEEEEDTYYQDGFHSEERSDEKFSREGRADQRGGGYGQGNAQGYFQSDSKPRGGSGAGGGGGYRGSKQYTSSTTDDQHYPDDFES